MIGEFAGSIAHEPNMIGYTPEMGVASDMLLLTEEFWEIPLYTGDDMWYCQPISDADAKGAVRCAKSGLMVPLHAQVKFEGKTYGARYAPVTRPRWFK